jgi:hypothetical protein
MMNETTTYLLISRELTESGQPITPLMVSAEVAGLKSYALEFERDAQHLVDGERDALEASWEFPRDQVDTEWTWTVDDVRYEIVVIGELVSGR